MHSKLLILAVILSFTAFSAPVQADWRLPMQMAFDGDEGGEDGGSGGSNENQTLDCEPVGDVGWDCKENIP